MRSFRSVEWSIVVVIIMVGAATRAENLGTGFVYQGELVLNDELVSEACDFRFTLWDAAMDGTQIGAPISLTETPISGRFAVELDFGPDAINGEARWLEIAVCTPSPCAPAYSTLVGRQKLAPAPHSIRASTGVGGPTALNVDANDKVGIGTTRATDEEIRSQWGSASNGLFRRWVKPDGD